MDERIVKAVERDGLGSKAKDVLILCYDRIVSGEVTTVADLFDYLKDLGWDPRLETIIRRSYALIRSIHWGMFRNLDAKVHPDLWRALTVTNRTMPDVADIKRNVVVPDLFCGMLDIHAYTEFCQKNRHNVAMLRSLDDLINSDMRGVADRNGCLATRTNGDMIIVIGPSATAIISACLGIISTFSRKRIMQVVSISDGRKGRSVVMQDFHVSAGIAGGQHYNSLIITQDGDISGNVVNIASRLQGFAGTIAPASSKVMVASHVHACHAREIAKERLRRTSKTEEASIGEELVFFDCGRIGFKGVSIGVLELLYTEREMKRIRYQSAYSTVLKATEKGVWSDQLVPQVTWLVARVLETNPIGRVEIPYEGQTRTFTSIQIFKLCQEALSLYESGEDHRTVSARLQLIATLLDASSGFDVLVRMYFTRIVSAYDEMVREFEAVQNERILENQMGLFSAKERSVIGHAERLERMRDALLERGKKDNSIYSSTMLWNKIVSDFESGLDFNVYVGKR